MREISKKIPGQDFYFAIFMEFQIAVSSHQKCTIKTLITTVSNCKLTLIRRFSFVLKSFDVETPDRPFNFNQSQNYGHFNTLKKYFTAPKNLPTIHLKACGSALSIDLS